MPGCAATATTAAGSPARDTSLGSGDHKGFRDADAALPVIANPQRVSPLEAKELSKVFLARLACLPEGTPQYQYVRNTLIEMNLTLVQFASRAFRSRTGTPAGAGTELEDVVQAGTIGLIKAIDRFDPERGVEFASLALPYITGEMKRHFRDTTWAVRVPRRLQELRVELAKARDTMAATLGRAPTVRELADHLNLEEDEVIEGLVAANGYSTETLEPFAPCEEDNVTAQALGRQPASEETTRAIDLFENLHALGPLLERLPERDREILYLRFGRELTQSEIGAELGISQMQVSRLLTRILSGLRTAMLDL
ncbi:SigB/SigF/SigG family RNA polymerase sigma factor [Streptomyces sp. NPDC058611]|uniref:SigB/SigF/SigG family RNA polymerase sigma factor n=1 Tax=unclassified Streptomyces TaxID=2593676 RepID=UPI003647FF0C